MRIPTLVPSLLAASLFFPLGASAADKPEKPAAKPPADYVIGELHVETLKDCTYLYISTETSFAEIAKSIPENLGVLTKAAGAAGIHFTGPAIFIYHDAKPEGKFQLELGFPVSPETKPPGDLKVRNLAAFHCATLLYNGATAHIGEAYSKLFEQLVAAGYVPTEESREMTLYWEGPDSPNNVIQLMVGVQ